MKIKRKIYGFTIFSFLMIFSGLIMAFCTGWALTHFAKTAELWTKISIIPPIFYYYYLPLPFVKYAMILRFLLAILQIVTGIFFFELKSWSLRVFRLLIILGVTTTFLNPFYPTIFILIAALYYLVFLVYLFHPKTDMIFKQGYVLEAPQLTGPILSEMEQQKNGRSKGVAIFGSLELLIVLTMLRVWWWTIPLGGVILEMVTRFGMKFPLSISKVTGLMVLMVIYLASLLTLYFRPLGRKLNLVFCIVGMITTIGFVFMINQSKLGPYQLPYLFFIIFTLFSSFLGFAVLTNPKIRSQFQIHPIKWRWKFLSFTTTIVVSLFMIVLFRGLIRNYPWLFDKTVLMSVIFNVEQKAEQTDRGLQWESMTKEFMRLYNDKDFSGAEKIAQKALKLAEEIFGSEHANTAISLNNLGLLYLSDKRFSDSEFLLKRSLKINQTALGPEHPKVGTDMNNLAELYRGLKDYKTAESYYINALQICEKAYGPDSMYVKIIRENLESLRQEIEDQRIREQEVAPSRPSIFETEEDFDLGPEPVMNKVNSIGDSLPGVIPQTVNQEGVVDTEKISDAAILNKTP